MIQSSVITERASFVGTETSAPAEVRVPIEVEVTISDDEIARAILLLLERAKQIVERAGAAGVAALLSDDLDVRGETVMPFLCGGNLDMTILRTVLIHVLTDHRQLLHLRVRIDDVPGGWQNSQC